LPNSQPSSTAPQRIASTINTNHLRALQSQNNTFSTPHQITSKYVSQHPGADFAFQSHFGLRGRLQSRLRQLDALLANTRTNPRLRRVKLVPSSWSSVLSSAASSTEPTRTNDCPPSAQTIRSPHSCALLGRCTAIGTPSQIVLTTFPVHHHA
jgi:hypothetical protein